MDPGLTSELLTYGPGGLIAALAIGALIIVWRLWQASDAARDSEGKLAADALFEQKLLNVRSESSLDRKDDRIAQLERELTRCERDLDRCRSAPLKDGSP